MKTSHPSFKPPFCPRPQCRYHRGPEGWDYIEDGTHLNMALARRIQHYRCLECNRSCSTQTFDTTYWLKKPDLLPKIFRTNLACSGFKHIADIHGGSHTPVARHCARLGRHCLLFHQLKRPAMPTRGEALVLDGFESFEFRQYWPFELQTLVGARSQFLHGFSDTPLRRSGRMTPGQEKAARRARGAVRPSRPQVSCQRRGAGPAHGGTDRDQPHALE